MSVEAGPVIASRIVTDDGRTVTVEVGKLAAVRGGAECAFRIGDDKGVCRGTDQLAALYHALTEIGARLARANHDAGRARFAVDAQLGFPDSTAAAFTDDSTPQRTGQITEPVGERTITHAGQQHSVAIGRPYRSPDHSLVLCPFQVDHRPVAVASGHGGMHALLTAFAMIGGWLCLPQDWPTSTAP